MPILNRRQLATDGTASISSRKKNRNRLNALNKDDSSRRSTGFYEVASTRNLHGRRYASIRTAPTISQEIQALDMEHSLLRETLVSSLPTSLLLRSPSRVKEKL